MEFALIKGVSVDGLRTKEWIKLKTLGSGTYGVVYLAKPKDPDSDQVFAVKTSSYEELQIEHKILQACAGCENIVKCYGELAASIHREKLVYNLFLEYAPGGNLFDLIQKYNGDKIPESDAKCYTRMLVEGLRNIHQRGFIHCDLKPENILVYPSNENGSISSLKIADFGMAMEFEERIELEVPEKEEDYDPCYPGTPLYMPPESVDAERVTSALDIWSLGCILLEMVTGKPPWKFRDLKDFTEQLLSDGNLPEVPESMSSQGKDFLMKCFAKDPSERWSADMLLRHPFLLQECSTYLPSPSPTNSQVQPERHFSSVEEPRTLLLFV